MKRIFICVALAGLSLVACKKEGNNDNPDVSPAANVLLIHAAPVPAGFAGVNAFLDTGKITPAAIAYLGNNQATGTTGSLFYMPVIATPNRNFDVRPTTALTTKLIEQQVNLEPARNYTYILYDTLNDATGKFKLLKLTDDLSQPADTSQSKIRFLHLAPNIPNVDVTFIRLSGTTEVDSVTFANRSYVGSTTPNEAALSAFTNVKGGVYRVRAKAAGTGTVLATINNSSGSLSFASGKVYTVFVTGTAKGQPLALRSVRHF
jgi:hypothetical protein